MLDVAEIKVTVASQHAQLTVRLSQNILLGIWEEYDILKEKPDIRNQWVNCNNGLLKQTKENWKWI
jgi:hypothetical protein